MSDDTNDLKKLLWAVVVGLAVCAVVSGFNAYESHQANVHATEANRILEARDFDRIHREHRELLEKCGAVRP